MPESMPPTIRAPLTAVGLLTVSLLTVRSLTILGLCLLLVLVVAILVLILILVVVLILVAVLIVVLVLISVLILVLHDMLPFSVRRGGVYTAVRGDPSGYGISIGKERWIYTEKVNPSSCSCIPSAPRSRRRQRQ